MILALSLDCFEYWDRYDVPKRRYLTTNQRCVSPQKNEGLIDAAAKTETTNRTTKFRGADKSLARPGRKQPTATEDFDVHIQEC